MNESMANVKLQSSLPILAEKLCSFHAHIKITLQIVPENIDLTAFQN